MVPRKFPHPADKQKLIKCNNTLDLFNQEYSKIEYKARVHAIYRSVWLLTPHEISSLNKHYIAFTTVGHLIDITETQDVPMITHQGYEYLLFPYRIDWTDIYKEMDKGNDIPGKGINQPLFLSFRFGKAIEIAGFPKIAYCLFTFCNKHSLEELIAEGKLKFITADNME